jgi:hypothetical protein
MEEFSVVMMKRFRSADVYLEVRKRRGLIFFE